MKKAFDDYTRLAGGAGLSGSLWQGPDHLLVIEGKGFVLPFREVYRRIDYQNIQALTYARTGRFGWLIALWLGLLALFALFLYASFRRNGWDTASLVLIIPATLAALALLIHLERGSTCVCCLQTAVLSLRLKPLRRVKKAAAVLTSLHALCEQHQGVAIAPLSTGAAPIELTPLFQGKPEWRGSRVAQWAMALLALWGGLFAGEMFVTSVIYLLSHLALLAAVFVLLVITLAQMTRYRAIPAFIAVLWSAMAVLALAGISIFVTLVILTSEISIRHEANTQFDYASLQKLAALNFHEAGYAAWLFISLGVIGVILGGMGYLLAIPRGAGGGGEPAPRVPDQPAPLP